MVQIWRRSKKCHQKTIIGDNNTAPQLKDLMERDVFENKNCFHTFFPIGFKFHSARYVDISRVILHFRHGQQQSTLTLILILASTHKNRYHLQLLRHLSEIVSAFWPSSDIGIQMCYFAALRMAHYVKGCKKVFNIPI